MNLSHRIPAAAAAALTLTALAVLAGPAPAAAELTRYTVDPAHTSAGFSVRHFVSQVPGRFNDVSGTIAYDPEKPAASSVEITVQAASLDTNHADRDNHLRSADFFDVANHPTLTFKSAAVKPTGNHLEVTGDLTIRGVTKRVTVPVEVLGVMGKKAGFAARFTIDRQEFGVSWNRAVEGGGAILGDEVAIDIAIEANREEPPAPAASSS
jgi:polyisoprenoid-binding protein YceI